MSGLEGSQMRTPIEGPDQQYTSHGIDGVDLLRIPRCSKISMNKNVRNIRFARSVHDLETRYWLTAVHDSNVVDVTVKVPELAKMAPP